MTNAEYLRFVREGGYRDASLWAPRDWDWRASEGLEHPASWIARGDGFAWHGMFGDVPLPLAWPARGLLSST